MEISVPAYQVPSCKCIGSPRPGSGRREAERERRSLQLCLLRCSTHFISASLSLSISIFLSSLSLFISILFSLFSSLSLSLSGPTSGATKQFVSSSFWIQRKCVCTASEREAPQHHPSLKYQRYFRRSLLSIEVYILQKST